MAQRPIPCLFMRAGTSRGPFIAMSDLPAARGARDRALLAIMGAHEDGRQLDGLGGGDSLTNKAGLVAPSSDPDFDVEYTFAQVDGLAGRVDMGPSCGNMLAGVAPFALETGMVAATDGETRVRILDRNTGARIVATVKTPDARPSYDGLAPVALSFEKLAGAKTGSALPTGRATDVIDGLTVSCVDVATPMLLINAADLGLAGDETPDDLDGRPALLARIERMRLEAGRRMGLGDVSKSVLPKVALLSPASEGGSIRSRYLTPWRAHKAHAVTGAICIAAAARLPATIACELAAAGDGPFVVEHPAGRLEVDIAATADDDFSAAVVRSARLIMRGEVMAPASLFEAAGERRRHVPQQSAIEVRPGL